MKKQHHPNCICSSDWFGNVCADIHTSSNPIRTKDNNKTVYVANV